MKHILFYTDTPNLGGAEKHMLLLAKHLSKKGIAVSLAYGKYSKVARLHDEFVKYCEEIYVLNTLHKHDPRHYSELKEVLSKNKFDLIHIHVWNPASGRYAFFAAYSKAVPIVATEHDPFELSGPKKWIKNACLEKADHIITVSQDNFRLLGEFYGVPPKRLKIVKNGIELDSFLDNHDKADLPVDNGPVITCIAELHHRKGHRYLLEAFRKLQAHLPQLNLILVGAGPAEHELKERFGQIPNVHFLGWRDDIPQILRASDILILPSLKEAFGQVILEAMASGVVAIGTNNGGIPDIIKDGVTGYLIPPASSQAIFERVTTILKNPHQMEDVKRAALASVKKDYTAEKMAEGTLAVYEEVW